MGARDPDTGQFVSGGSSSGGHAYGDVPEVVDELNYYDDFVHQTVYSSFKLDLTANSGGNLGESDQGGWTWWDRSVARGELDRDQVAELVYLEPEILEVALADPDPNDNGHTTPGLIRMEAEVTDPERDDTAVQFDSGIGFEDVSLESGDTLNPSNVTAAPQYEEANDGPLWFGIASCEAPWNDTVNGTGGGGGMQAAQNMAPRYYRSIYGRGPMFEHDHTIRSGATLEWTDVENGTIHGAFRVRMAWDVFELEPRELREVRGA